jgi:hypothetical protein
MGTIVYQNGFSLMINPKERSHKHMPHCHAIGGGCVARIHLQTFDVLTNTGFSRNDMRKILEAVRFHQDELMAKWEEYHGKE